MKTSSRNSSTLLWGSIVLFLTTFNLGAETYTYPQLVKRMTDLQQLATLPPAGETTSMASSYDRSSQYDASHDQYINWGAKKSDSGIVRMEGDESVLADIQGPGCLWRISVSSARQGHMKIFLDGAVTPAVDMPVVDYFSGHVGPFNRPNLVYALPNRWKGSHDVGFDNYTPISFQKSCKIVADKGWGNRYQFTYTRFPEGTVVPTFQMKLSPEDAAALDNANNILGRCADPPGPTAGEKTEIASIHAEPGKESPVTVLTGSGAITALKVKLDLPKDPEALRSLLGQLTLSITWDGGKSPAVWSPLGDFFGYAGGGIPFKSLPVGLSEDGTFYSYWCMPYGTEARIVVGNDGDQPVNMTWQVTHAPLSKPISNFARFHAKWHRDLTLDRPDRQPDWPLLTTQGQGRYVGTHLHGWNPLGIELGEGGEKFFVDGEKFPSSFGTRSENYFGYAERNPILFSKPYHNQILNERNENHFADNRWHISDSLPFQTSFEGYIAKFVPNTRYAHYAAEVFWYLAAGGSDSYGALSVADRIGWWDMPPVFHEPGVIEAASLFALNPPSQQIVLVNTGSGNMYSGGHVLQWWPKGAEKAISLNFTVAKAGSYHFIIRYTIREDHGQGIVQFSVDRKVAGTPQLLFGPKDTVSPPVDLGVMDLTPGPHALGIEYVQKGDTGNPSKAPYFGLDYIKLDPAL